MNSFDDDPVRNLPLVTQPRPGPKRAAWWQIALTTFALVAIVAIFLWGVNNQHEEATDQQTAATQNPATPEAPPSAVAPQDHTQKTNPSTTGQGGSETGGQQQNGDVDKSHQPLDSNGEQVQQKRK
jgi:cytoskeletal protein RodZ